MSLIAFAFTMVSMLIVSTLITMLRQNDTKQSRAAIYQSNRDTNDHKRLK